MSHDESGVETEVAYEANDMMEDVAAFHRKFGHSYDGKPRVLPSDLFRFRQEFHYEEIEEYGNEQGLLEIQIAQPLSPRNAELITEGLDTQLDSLVDAAFVILGTAELQFGAARFNEAWRRVVKANMTKVIAEGNPDAMDSGRKAKYDIRKPPGWEAPSHIDLVQDHIHRYYDCEDEGCPHFGTHHGHSV